MLDLFIFPEAEEEIKASFDWYEAQASGLGIDFISELDRAFNSIKTLPDVWPKYQTYFQRFLLSRFPFSVVFEVEAQQIIIYAVMHNSRKPGYWEDRI
ncbi:type II toxin-antitoxin system RelE/ParE family toxin [Marinicella rhabdoformis]|uniref:type II toxin-antitoxin system RelE/ParE family toxin n=1 Tax=Marinicella rhabdoformis TaxID=2580566 RepID=UPI0012AEDF11|nr:type II toxin-antitoxin system RelE/ParE family toxin [Marinicella rhabdoformis]